MTTNDDAYLQAQGEGTMRPVEPSAPVQESWDPEPVSEMTVAPPAPVSTSDYAAMQTPPAPAPTPAYGAAEGYAAPGGYAAPDYAAPGGATPGYAAPGQPAYGYAPRPTKTWMNVTSLVCALLVPVVGSLLAVIFGHLGVAASKRGDAEYKGIGIAGLVLGYLGLIAGIVYLVAAIALVASSSTVTVQ
ncbi:DUF4190 domain-containing protein [Demequina rhizosphaerae]|uniref:DUF4190 domain-containing protein n=1 Tax=Demequina rhizosphaerae TaxID=1638985 RepID=UPI000783C9AF|nr:DUF4190 domain-containing protein [Demequina rhizosphaerae]